MTKALKILLVALILSALAYLAAIFYLQSRDPFIKWDWSKIDLNKVCYPKEFLWGTATAAYQVEGGFTNSNWNWWENQTLPDGKPAVLNHQKCGAADDDWNLYPIDIQLMKKLGVNAYRFSVAWSKIFPYPDSVNTIALRHYQDLCDSLINNNITPVVTLFHFTYPKWFLDSGGFVYQKNIKYFVKFAVVVHQALKDRVRYWITVNEPVVFAYEGYFVGEYPPGKSNPQLAAKVLVNLLFAHVAVYDTLKKLSKDKEIYVGIVKNITQMDPYRRFNLMDNLIAYFADLNFNQAYLKAFKTNQFAFYLPGTINFKAKVPKLHQSIDFIGLNYYSHNAFKFVGDIEKSLNALPYPGEQLTDMNYTVYPEGIYRAIKRVSKLGFPIIITENGIADSLDNRRYAFIRRSLYAVSKAIADGYDVRGYFYWSLLDNFEWNLGYTKKFGLYKVNFKTQKRYFRPGSKAFIEVINLWKQKCLNKSTSYVKQ